MNRDSNFSVEFCLSIWIVSFRFNEARENSIFFFSSVSAVYFQFFIPDHHHHDRFVNESDSMCFRFVLRSLDILEPHILNQNRSVRIIMNDDNNGQLNAIFIAI